MNDAQIDYWNGAAGNVWAAQQARLDRQLAPLGRATQQALAARPGERLLDVGCGSGDSTLELGAAVGPAGRVVGVDVSRPLLDVARARRPPAHVTFVEGDAQTLTFAEPFDGVYSRFGVMFFADPVAAFANLRRALRRGGRLAFVCWRALEENPALTVPVSAAAKLLPPPPPPPDPAAPGPFSLADRGRIARLLEAAGFADARIVAHDEAIGGNDLEATVELAMQVGPLGARLREHPDRRGAVIDAVRGALAPYLVDGVARLPSASWIVTARTAS
jgi:SAM-dependent methyltransferase